MHNWQVAESASDGGEALRELSTQPLQSLGFWQFGLAHYKAFPTNSSNTEIGWSLKQS